MSRFITTARTAALALILSATASTPATAAEMREALEAKGDYGTFLKALDASDAGWFLEDEEGTDVGYTLFVPTDEAFGKLPEGVLDALLEEENLPKLNAILEGHVVPDAVEAASDLSDGETLDPATGEPLNVSVDGDAVTIEGIAVVDPNITGENGLAHGIEEVIVPEMVVQAMKFTGDYPTEDGDED